MPPTKADELAQIKREMQKARDLAMGRGRHVHDPEGAAVAAEALLLRLARLLAKRTAHAEAVEAILQVYSDPKFTKG